MNYFDFVAPVLYLAVAAAVAEEGPGITLLPVVVVAAVAEEEPGIGQLVVVVVPPAVVVVPPAVDTVAQLTPDIVEQGFAGVVAAGPLEVEY